MTKFDENSNHEENSSEDKDIDETGDEQSTEQKPNSGDGSNNDEDTQDFLARINKETGKNFKSVEDWKKSVKNLEKSLAEKGRKKEDDTEVPPIKNNKLVETLFFDKHPEAQEYWETVEKEAETLGKDPFDLYLSSTLLQKEAKAKFAKKQKKKDAENRMGKPSNKVDTAGTEEDNPFDKDYPTGFAVNEK